MVVLSVVAEVLAGKQAALGLARRQGLGHDRCDACVFAGHDLVTVEVAAVGQGGDLLAAVACCALNAMGASWWRSYP